MVFIKKHVKFILVLVTFFIGLVWCIVKRENDYFTHLNRITKKFIIEMEERYDLSCTALGGELSGNIKIISLTFKCFQRKTIEEARMLEVECTERLREMVNSNEKIRPYLEKFPFPSEAVEIMIHFYKEDIQNFPPEESISLVMSCKEKLVYKMVFNDHRPDQTVLREPYSEAYKKVKGTSVEE